VAYYAYIYEGWVHGESHPDDKTALEAIDQAKKQKGLLRVERVQRDTESQGDSAPQCHAQYSDTGEVIWRID
jgi:hypothetical protein